MSFVRVARNLSNAFLAQWFAWIMICTGLGVKDIWKENPKINAKTNQNHEP